jgi:hypothetical protein
LLFVVSAVRLAPSAPQKQSKGRILGSTLCTGSCSGGTTSPHFCYGQCWLTGLHQPVTEADQHLGQHGPHGAVARGWLPFPVVQPPLLGGSDIRLLPLAGHHDKERQLGFEHGQFLLGTTTPGSVIMK